MDTEQAKILMQIETFSCPYDTFTSKDYKYLSFYQNCYGEKWVFATERKSKKSFFTGSDIGWHKVYVNHNTHPLMIKAYLNDVERKWLDACLDAVNL